jgi:hypothetical protein
MSSQLPMWLQNAHDQKLLQYSHYIVFVERPQEHCALFNCRIPINQSANEFLEFCFIIRELRDNHAVIFGDWHRHPSFVAFNTPQAYRAASKSRPKQKYNALLSEISGIADPLVQLKWEKTHDGGAVGLECSHSYYNAVKQQLQPVAAELYSWVF